mmetsp:Transcript_18875/g.44316  ORF Transcript_18875/g.44316 Transcript_18875/m.44316 type:complete len:308 (+) Transcript_18875:468-1391(+)
MHSTVTRLQPALAVLERTGALRSPALQIALTAKHPAQDGTGATAYLFRRAVPPTVQSKNTLATAPAVWLERRASTGAPAFLALRSARLPRCRAHLQTEPMCVLTKIRAARLVARSMSTCAMLDQNAKTAPVSTGARQTHVQKCVTCTKSPAPGMMAATFAQRAQMAARRTAPTRSIVVTGRRIHQHSKDSTGAQSRSVRKSATRRSWHASRKMAAESAFLEKPAVRSSARSTNTHAIRRRLVLTAQVSTGAPKRTHLAHFITAARVKWLAWRTRATPATIEGMAALGTAASISMYATVPPKLTARIV